MSIRNWLRRRSLDASVARDSHCGPAMVESLEPRLLLSAYSLYGGDYLNVGNRWQFAVHVTMDAGQTTDDYQTLTSQVARSQDVNGVQTRVIEHFSSTGSFSASYEYLAGDYLMRAKTEDFTVYGTSTLTVMNDNPLELAPRAINDTDNNRLVGQGQFLGEADWRDDWTLNSHVYMTYLGTETLSTAIGTFDCVRVLVRTVQEGGSGTSYEWQWLNPAVGKVRSYTELYLNDGGATPIMVYESVLISVSYVDNPQFEVITTATDLNKTSEQVYAIRWEDAGIDRTDAKVRVQLFFHSSALWDPTIAAADELDEHRFHDLADVNVLGSVARRAHADGTADDGLWVRLENLAGSPWNYVYAAIVDETTGKVLAWDRSSGRLVIASPTSPASEVLTTRLAGGFNKSVREAADQDANGKACYVIRWSDAAVPTGATIDVKYGISDTYDDDATDFCHGWGAGTSGGDSKGNQATGIAAAPDGQSGDSFKWFIGDISRVARGTAFYMWVIIRDVNGDILATARSIGKLTIIA